MVSIQLVSLADGAPRNEPRKEGAAVQRQRGLPSGGAITEAQHPPGQVGLEWPVGGFAPDPFTILAR
jgi:hypothetical protein